MDHPTARQPKRQTPQLLVLAHALAKTESIPLLQIAL